MQKPTPQEELKRQKQSGTVDDNKSRHAITIGRPLDDVFKFWRNLQNLPKFMKDLDAVNMIGSQKSHWVVRLKSGRTVEWDAQITEEVQNQKISWASMEGSEVSTSGQVTFQKASGNRGTVVSLSMDYKIPGGRLAEWATFFTGEDPDTLAITNLKRLKQYLETGEIATTQGQPSGRTEDQSAAALH